MRRFRIAYAVIAAVLASGTGYLVDAMASTIAPSPTIAEYRVPIVLSPQAVGSIRFGTPMATAIADLGVLLANQKPKISAGVGCRTPAAYWPNFTPISTTASSSGTRARTPTTYRFTRNISESSWATSKRPQSQLGRPTILPISAPRHSAVSTGPRRAADSGSESPASDAAWRPFVRPSRRGTRVLGTIF
jgi:hypothetical protein